MYRTDKFKAGDKVTWFDEEYATLVDGRKKYGNGPFLILEVKDREFQPASYDDDQSNWDSMGHTQHLVIDIDALNKQYSGAFFKKV